MNKLGVGMAEGGRATGIARERERKRAREAKAGVYTDQKQTSVDPVTGGFTNLQCGHTLLGQICTKYSLIIIL